MVSTGLSTYASHNPPKDATTFFTSSRAVTITIFAPPVEGIPVDSSMARISRTAALPSISGIMLSMQTTSYAFPSVCAKRKASTAYLPLRLRGTPLRADRKFTFSPLQADSDDVLPKSACRKFRQARLWELKTKRSANLFFASPSVR